MPFHGENMGSIPIEIIYNILVFMFLSIVSSKLCIAQYNNKAYIFLKNIKSVLKFLLFLEKEGFLLRIIVLNNFLQVFLKYHNEVSTFRQIKMLTCNKRSLLLTISQIQNLVRIYPNLFFVFYCDGNFFNSFQILKKNKSAFLICFLL